MNVTAEQIEEARYWIAEQFPKRTVTDADVRSFVHENYPAGGWSGFLADNYL